MHGADALGKRGAGERRKPRLTIGGTALSAGILLRSAALLTHWQAPGFTSDEMAGVATSFGGACVRVRAASGAQSSETPED